MGAAAEYGGGFGDANSLPRSRAESSSSFDGDAFLDGFAPVQRSFENSSSVDELTGSASASGFEPPPQRRMSPVDESGGAGDSAPPHAPPPHFTAALGGEVEAVKVAARSSVSRSQVDALHSGIAKLKNANKSLEEGYARALVAAKGAGGAGADRRGSVASVLSDIDSAPLAELNTQLSALSAADATLRSRVNATEAAAAAIRRAANAGKK